MYFNRKLYFQTNSIFHDSSIGHIKMTIAIVSITILPDGVSRCFSCALSLWFCIFTSSGYEIMMAGKRGGGVYGRKGSLRSKRFVSINAGIRWIFEFWPRANWGERIFFALAPIRAWSKLSEYPFSTRIACFAGYRKRGGGGKEGVGVRRGITDDTCYPVGLQWGDTWVHF